MHQTAPASHIPSYTPFAMQRPRFAPLRFNLNDEILGPIAKPLVEVPGMLGRRLTQSDPLNPNGGKSDTRETRVFSFIGGIVDWEEEENAIFVEVRVSRNIDEDSLIFKISGSDSRDLKNRFELGMLVGFSIRSTIEPDGKPTVLLTSEKRDYLIPHGVVYLP